ncbi:MAG: TetR family transcriptional regulator, partial [Planctomyces sp.]
MAATAVRSPCGDPNSGPVAGVAAAAGVSQGALFKHFDTKTALLAAAAEAALAALIDDFRAQVGT